MSDIEWIPSFEEYNPGISKDKWLEILDNRNITTDANLHVLACMYNFGGEATCTQLAQKYGETKNTYNSGSSNYAKKLVKAKICEEPPLRDNGNNRWWPVLYVGHAADKETPGSFVWKLRDELKEACKEYGIEKWLEISFLNDFTWIPFYEEISHALLRYKENRLDLVNILVSSLNELGINSGMYRNEYGPLTNIDPFTFMGGFNRGNKREDRIKIANRIAEKIGIESRLSEEENFFGIPTLNSEHSTLFYRGCPENDYDKLWNLFEASLNFDLFSPEVFIEAFDNALSVTGTGQKYATMASFWINPYNILAVDENNINYLNKYGISVSSNLTGSTYIDLLRQITTKMEKHEITETTFPDFSYAAWKFPKRSYWACGFHYGDENEDNQYERFITNSIWSARFQKDKTRDLKQLERAKKIKEGDVLVLKTSFVRDRKKSITKLYAIGIVKGEKKITEDATYSYYTIDVEYNAIDDRPEFGCTYMETIMEIRNDELKSFVMNNMGDVAMGKNPNDLNKYIDLLTENKNIILHGAPGTGKTYLAKQIAEAMGCSKEEIGFCQFHPSYDYTDFVEGLRPTKNNGFERKDGTFKTFCKKALRNLIDSKKTAEERSQEKSIEEQISSFISDSVDNEIEYELLGRKTKFTITNYDEKKIYISAANKIAKEIEVKISDLVEILSSKKDFGQAKEIANFFNHPNYGYQSDSYVFALYKQLISVISDKKSDSIESRVEKKTFVFIIDEINRGELSKIFGELFFSIDPGYRGGEGRVYTQYQNLIEDDLFTDGFYIPENVYIIGTMNDIDRSVESMDFAMRRRFTFVEVSAEESSKNMNITGDALQKMNAINKVIAKMPELGKSYCIGAAYFKNAEDLQKLWDLKISSLVYEYLRGIDNYSDEHKDGEKFDEIKSAYEKPDSVVLDK